MVLLLCQYSISDMQHINRRNHPHTTVCCQDTNNLLRYVVERDNGGDPKRLPSLGGPEGTLCPEMPKKGDQVDFIFGGKVMVHRIPSNAGADSFVYDARPSLPSVQSHEPQSSEPHHCLP